MCQRVCMRVSEERDESVRRIRSVSLLVKSRGKIK